MKIVIGVTGASGAALASETLRQLRQTGAETHLVLTAGAHIAIAHELGPSGAAAMREAASFSYESHELGAPIASGSFGAAAMAVGNSSAGLAHCPLHRRRTRGLAVLAAEAEED